jgi:5'-nucleotidase
MAGKRRAQSKSARRRPAKRRRGGRRRLRILVTNDDGVYSEGIKLLAGALADHGEVVVVAPDREQSATGHSLTLQRPLRMQQLEKNWFSVDGTPTDCVNLAVLWLLRKRRPDLVVSGINFGLNLGDDVTYSGTVSGALEAALLGAPAIAVSLMRTRDWKFDFGPSAAIAHDLAARVLASKLPERTFLNVNVPKGQPKGVRVTVQGKRNHVTTIARREDPRGMHYFWIEEGLDDWLPHDHSDYQACRDGYVSVTPLQPDMTAHAAMTVVGKWLGQRPQAAAAPAAKPNSRARSSRSSAPRSPRRVRR